MKAINLFAGIGTMTRAFFAHGAEIVWAQEERGTEAAVYRYNFPQVPLFYGALENGMEQIPEHDLLLASVRCTSYSVAGSALRYGREAKTFEERNRTEKDIELLGKVLEKHRPAAVCIMLPQAAVRGTAPIIQKMQEILSEEAYHSEWRLLRGTEHGRIPFSGRKCYLVGFQDEKEYSEFMFPEADRFYEPVKAATQWHVIEDKQYYAIPGWCKELFRDEKPDPGKIYSVVYEKRENGTCKTVKKLDNCPILVQRSWYRTFVFDGYGIRRITPKEYMAVQGDRETRFPVDMSHGKIWETLGHAGIYGIEEKIAFRVRQVLEGNSLQETIAEYLLGEFDDKKFLYRKKAGMVCMPTGTGYTKTVKYLVQGIIKRTEEKWKIIVLETNRMSCSQMEQILQDIGYTVQTSVSLEDTNNFLMNSREILVLTYTGWENYIRRFKPKGVHVNLVLLGAHAERGWRCLTGTEKYLPQVIYAGVASSPDLEAAEVFGPIRYQYTLQQAYKDHLMIPVNMDYLNVPSIPENALAEYSLLAEKIWEDMLLYGEKALIIAESISQAQYLQRRFLHICEEARENWNAYLCVSEQTAEEREGQIDAFRNSYRSVMITVAMWRDMQISDVSQIYVLKRAGRNELWEILGLASVKYPGKQSVRVVIQEREVLEEAQALTNIGENNKDLEAFCTHLWEGKYVEAALDYERVKVFSIRLAEQLKKELEACRDQVSMMKLWPFTSKLAMQWEQSQNWNEEVSVVEEEETKNRQQEEGKAEEKEEVHPAEEAGSAFKNAAEKGAALENALLRLLRRLFTWNREDNPEFEEKMKAVLRSLQKRPGGDQNGRDLDLVYLDETGQRRRCYFECKFIQSKKIDG